jgi:CTP synthase
MVSTSSDVKTEEALLHAGIHTKTKVNIHYFDSEEIEEKGVGCLASGE